MLKSEAKSKKEFFLQNPRPQHFEQIQELCKRVYPFSKPWSIAQLESHQAYFPDGQLIVIERASGKVVGLAFSLIILWNDYSHQDNWQDFTSSGFFHNHDPQKGKTLYGAEVMVDPEYRGMSIAKMLYSGRQRIVEKYNLKRIRAGARLRGYAKYKNQMSAKDYTLQVVQKKIYDPTLSFQLSNDFHVIDVAPNYLFNDPESLGFAAVIEWLNPKLNSPADFDKQKKICESFNEGVIENIEFLPRELRRVVRKSTTLLGEIIRKAEGDDFFNKVENYRERLKQTRSKKNSAQDLDILFKKIKSESQTDQAKLAHAFSLQLEIVNACESAYRSWRLRQKQSTTSLKYKLDLNFSLTAHPTEARSKFVIELLNRIQSLLLEGIHNYFLFDDQSLKTQMQLLWLEPLSKSEKPTVRDEAEYIHSILFTGNIFDFILLNKPSYEINLRTWVGGDKDGHPGVQKNVMLDCLNLSRKRYTHYIQNKLIHTKLDLESTLLKDSTYKQDISNLKKLIRELEHIENIRKNDGNRVKKWIYLFNNFLKKSNPVVRDHSNLTLIHKLTQSFPALLLPLEIREDAGLVFEALNKRNISIIREMLFELGQIKGIYDIKAYAKSFIISHCESSDDLEHANQLLSGLKLQGLPIVPLFESQKALLNSTSILEEWLKNKNHLEKIKRHWNNQLEIMLGYSDSAKELGVFASRLLIHRSMLIIDKKIKKYGFKIVVFHGSGGSIARGGGNLREQISWWSTSAIEKPKLTIQGEMIQRTFSSREIFNSQCSHLSTEAFRRRRIKPKFKTNDTLIKLSQLSSRSYQKLVFDSKKLGLLIEATPYRYLNLLKIGSRPNKRSSGGDINLNNLRAIPWVLCWTQTRLLLPAWWGLGEAWTQLSDVEKEELRSLLQSDAFFSSFIKSLGFTLAKVQIDIWNIYFQNLGNIKNKKINDELLLELKNTQKFFFDITKQKEFLWYRPWLVESIRLRSPHIHLLNLLQICAIKNENENLLKETVVGISCGMLTTG